MADFGNSDDNSSDKENNRNTGTLNNNHPHHSEDRGWTFADIAKVLLKTRRRG